MRPLGSPQKKTVFYGVFSNMAAITCFILIKNLTISDNYRKFELPLPEDVNKIYISIDIDEVFFNITLLDHCFGLLPSLNTFILICRCFESTTRTTASPLPPTSMLSGMSAGSRWPRSWRSVTLPVNHILTSLIFFLDGFWFCCGASRNMYDPELQNKIVLPPRKLRQIKHLNWLTLAEISTSFQIPSLALFDLHFLGKKQPIQRGWRRCYPRSNELGVCQGPFLFYRFLITRCTIFKNGI